MVERNIGYYGFFGAVGFVQSDGDANPTTRGRAQTILPAHRRQTIYV
jgi:hypothetical protein